MNLDPLLARVEKTIARHALFRPGETVVVGVSGGADSLVLLHVLHSLDRWRLHVATLDHGMRGADGSADADFVRQMAAAWALPVTVGRADVPGIADRYRLNAEEAARQVRYAFLLRVARQIEAAAVAVGHHQGDQAETVLMHLIRGSGLDGLRGMLPAVPMSAFTLPYLQIDSPGLSSMSDERNSSAADLPSPRVERGERARHAGGEVNIPPWPIFIDPPFDHPPAAPEPFPVLVRPLLDVPRADIVAYAAANDLQPRHDATNDNLSYFRNRLRHEVIPLLAELNPNIRAALARTADLLRDDAALVHRAGEAAVQQTLIDMHADRFTLDRGRWRGLSAAEKRYVLRALIARLRPDQRDVEFEHVQNAIHIADTGTTGSAADLPRGLVLRVEYDTLVIGEADAVPNLNAPALPPDEAPRFFYPADRVRWQFGVWWFEAGPLEPGDDRDAIHADPLGAVLAVPTESQLVLRIRRPGDRFLPRGLGGHSQKLSDTLINMRVPKVWRDRVPLLLVEDRLAWFVAPTAAGDVRGRVAEPFARPAAGSESGLTIIEVRWNYRQT